MSNVVGSGKVVVYQAVLQAFNWFKLANVEDELLLELGAVYPPPPPPHETVKRRIIRNQNLSFINTPYFIKMLNPGSPSPF